MDDRKFRLMVRSWATVWSWALIGSMGASANPSEAQELAVTAQNLVTLHASTANHNDETAPEKVAANPSPNATPHPLDPALLFAQEKLEHLRKNVHDYEAVMIKQERIDGTLLPAEYMNVKIRNRRERSGRQQPFSVYMRFLRPNAIKGREVIYVENHNDGNIVAHEAGVLGMIRVNLAPRGTLAMRGNRYPITDAGIENLVEKLIERGNRDRAQGLCDVQFFENAKVMDRTCTMIQVKHEEEKPSLDFHIGRIYIDDEHQVPIRYEAYLWPENGETELPLLESYTYAKLKLNVGLTDSDFDPNNANYEFP
ncbi:MAG: DUF1571 domain-containing protein [Planctomycetaceae bacterium]|nr:DUF1571 domain-containing protein [Planctomycetaceae bacterium]